MVDVATEVPKRKRRGGRPKGSRNRTARGGKESVLLVELTQLEKRRNKIRRQLAKLFSR